MFDVNSFGVGVGLGFLLGALCIITLFRAFETVETQFSNAEDNTVYAPRYGIQHDNDIAAALADAESTALAAQYTGFSVRIQQLRRELAQGDAT